MYKVQLNKDTFRNHWQYDWWKYLLGIVLTIFVWNVGTTMARHQIPDDKKVDIYMVGEYYVEQAVEPISERMIKDFPELLEINFYPISFGGNGNADYMSAQKLTVMLGSQSGDLFVFDRQRFEALAQQGAFLPLDQVIGEDIRKMIPDDEWKSVTLKVKEDEEAVQKEEAEAHIYGVPLKGVTLFKDTGYPVEDKVISVMAYSKNKEKAAQVMKWILTKGR